MNNQDHQIDATDEQATASFDDFNLLPDVAEALERMGFSKPTPVQARTYAELMTGKDVIAMAQTGTGKTAAFGIPLAQTLDPNKQAVQSLVLVPTRELALQVTREIDKIGELRGIRSVAVYGGASFTKQVDDVQSNARVVVGTPGRVLDHIRRGTISFDAVKVLVLDEADEMLSMGFEKEISEIIDSLPKSRQTVLFSATIPDDIQRLSKRYMGDTTVVSVSGDEVGAKEISHFVYLVSGQGRTKDLVKVMELERPNSALVFCNTRDETQTVAAHLKANGYNAAWLNSDLSQNERERVMTATRAGKIDFLVATDVAARGIDVSHLSHVINYTFPESLEVYIHRTGRTGRMGRPGAAVSLIAPQDIGNLYYLRLTYKIFPVEKSLPDSKQAQLIQEFDRMDSLRNGFAGGADEDYTRLAKRLIQDVRGEKILAGLLCAYFERNQKAPEKKAVKTKPAEKKIEKPVEVKIEKPVEAEIVKQIEARIEKQIEAEKPKTEEEQTSDREIYVDAGRKDGMRISLLMREIVRLTDLPRSAIGKVRMLTRSSFINVPQEHFQTVLDAVCQIEVDGRKLKAEPAKQS